MMEDRELSELLKKLHSEIEHARPLSDEDQALLRDLDGHIRTLLNRSEGESTQPLPANFAQLEDAVSHFEVTHPGLTATLEKLMVILSSAGI